MKMWFEYAVRKVPKHVPCGGQLLVGTDERQCLVESNDTSAAARPEDDFLVGQLGSLVLLVMVFLSALEGFAECYWVRCPLIGNLGTSKGNKNAFGTD
jgi:hypothetical protein